MILAICDVDRPERADTQPASVSWEAAGLFSDESPPTFTSPVTSKKQLSLITMQKEEAFWNLRGEQTPALAHSCFLHRRTSNKLLNLPDAHEKSTTGALAMSSEDVPKRHPPRLTWFGLHEIQSCSRHAEITGLNRLQAQEI